MTVFAEDALLISMKKSSKQRLLRYIYIIYIYIYIYI